MLAILYKGGEAAKQEPRLLGTVENEVCHAMEETYTLVISIDNLLVARFAPMA